MADMGGAKWDFCSQSFLTYNFNRLGWPLPDNHGLLFKVFHVISALEVAGDLDRRDAPMLEA